MRVLIHFRNSGSIFRLPPPPPCQYPDTPPGAGKPCFWGKPNLITCMLNPAALPETGKEFSFRKTHCPINHLKKYYI
jgi:hypothetical protein